MFCVLSSRGLSVSENFNLVSYVNGGCVIVGSHESLHGKEGMTNRYKKEANFLDSWFFSCEGEVEIHACRLKHLNLLVFKLGSKGNLNIVVHHVQCFTCAHSSVCSPVCKERQAQMAAKRNQMICQYGGVLAGVRLGWARDCFDVTAFSSPFKFLIYVPFFKFFILRRDLFMGFSILAVCCLTFWSALLSSRSCLRSWNENRACMEKFKCGTCLTLWETIIDSSRCGARRERSLHPLTPPFLQSKWCQEETVTKGAAWAWFHIFGNWEHILWELEGCAKLCPPVAPCSTPLVCCVQKPKVLLLAMGGLVGTACCAVRCFVFLKCFR